MRATVEFTVAGWTIKEVISNARKIWKDINEDVDAELPSDAEVHLSDDDASVGYRAKFFIRTKVES